MASVVLGNALQGKWLMHAQPTWSILCATASNLILVLLENKANHMFIKEIPWKLDCQ